MPYIDVDFTNGEELPAIDLNQLSENLEVAREEANFSPILNTNCQLQGFGVHVGTLTVRLLINGGTFSGFDLHSGAGAFTKSDVNIESLADGLHTLDVSLAGGDVTKQFHFWFYKTPEMARLSYRLDLELYGCGYENNDEDEWSVAQVTGFSVIGHRVNKSFS